MAARPRLSLKGRGLQLLAQREHSRSELRRKLLSHARGASQTLAQGDAAPTASEADPVDWAGQVEAVLDWLQDNRYLSEERFAESRLHVRAARYGNLRIRQELAQHGVALSDAAARQLKDSELSRAQDVWARKFGQPADDAAGRAKQMRFLAARGFSSEVIRRVVQGRAEDPAES